MRQAGKLATNGSNFHLVNVFRDVILPWAFIPTTLKDCLAKSIPNVVMVIVTPPTGKCLFRISTLAHCDAVWVGRVHYIRYAKARDKLWK